MKVIKQMQIYLINNAQKYGPKILCIGCNAECYSTNYDCTTIPEFVSLLKNPKKTHNTYPTYPQVLFTNYEVIDKELFGSIAILNVCWLSFTYPPFRFSTAFVDLENDSSRIKFSQPYPSSEAWSKGVCTSVGIGVCHPRLYCDGCCYCELFRLSPFAIA